MVFKIVGQKNSGKLKTKQLRNIMEQKYVYFCIVDILL